MIFWLKNSKILDACILMLFYACMKPRVDETEKQTENPECSTVNRSFGLLALCDTAQAELHGG